MKATHKTEVCGERCDTDNSWTGLKSNTRAITRTLNTSSYHLLVLERSASVQGYI